MRLKHKPVSAKIMVGDCRTVLSTLPDESVDCIITSPPYYGLRDYGTGEWVGGDDHKCRHIRIPAKRKQRSTALLYQKVCKDCGAIRQDQQIGNESTPEAFIHALVKVFREAKRVLKDEGTLWINIGDSYAGSGKGAGSGKQLTNKGSAGSATGTPPGYKAKDLIGIPWMLGIALREEGWYLRQDIIWSKPNPMPESVKDRFTKSHEYVLLLSKSPKYYFDYKAVQEKATKTVATGSTRIFGKKGGQRGDEHHVFTDNGLRNKRSVWEVNVQPTKESHFATFPTKLITPAILAGCPKGGTVLDPFGGSGTTGMVATALGRNAILIELNEDYIKMQHNRVKKEAPLFMEVEHE